MGKSKHAGGEAFGRQAAAWLRAALRDERGREKMDHTSAIKRSKISRRTFYDILNSTGAVQEESLIKLARALKVPPPWVEVTLRTDDPSAAMVPPTLAKLKEAEALVREAIEELEAEGEPSATPRAGPIGEILEEDELLDRLPPGRTAHPPHKKQQRGRA